MNHCEIIVIGAGAAGMMAAITAAGKKREVLLLEHTNRVGKKILQTGNGRCNLTNEYMNSDCYCNEDKAFVEQVLKRFGTDQTRAFFYGMGLLTKSKKGYIYPNAEQAATVVETLQLELRKYRIPVKTEVQIQSITRRPASGQSTHRFWLATNQGEFSCDRLILAAGSKAAPKTGSDGSGYELAKQLGHSVIKPLPALVQLEASNKFCKSIAGVRSEGCVTAWIDEKQCAKDTGEIQFTDYGISGIPVFQISRYVVRALDAGQSVRVTADLVPQIEFEDLLSLLYQRQITDADKPLAAILSGLIHNKLAAAVIKIAKLAPECLAKEVPYAKMEQIAHTIKQLTFQISGHKSFEQGQICSGGIPTSEINPETMESAICENLYLAGEIMDVDGICGGYNLQWAWSTGFIAGSSASLP